MQPKPHESTVGRDRVTTTTLGDVIKLARQKKALTLRELAEDPEVAVSATFLSRIERNDALPSDELLMRIARRLELDAGSALMQLFRDRLSPEVREFLPHPSVFKARESAHEAERVAGMEALAEPMSQVLDIHRGVLEDNARLRERAAVLEDELRVLRGEVGTAKREFLPDVNRFLVSLFNYESEVVRRNTVVGRSGDAVVTVTLEGIRPKQGGRPLPSLSHLVYIPQANDGSLRIAGQPVNFEILEKPADLALDYEFHRESSERGSFEVRFPDGFHWSADGGKLSYSFTYRLEKAFVMTMEDAKASYGRRTVHDSPLEWSSCFINKPVRRLEIAVSFPEGYTPNYIDKWVWWTEMSFLESEHNLSDRLLLDPCDGIEIETGDRTVVRLRAENPLLGFSYGIVWQPLSKRQFLNLIQK